MRGALCRDSTSSFVVGIGKHTPIVIAILLAVVVGRVRTGGGSAGTGHGAETALCHIEVRRPRLHQVRSTLCPALGRVSTFGRPRLRQDAHTHRVAPWVAIAPPTPSHASAVEVAALELGASSFPVVKVEAWFATSLRSSGADPRSSLLH